MIAHGHSYEIDKLPGFVALVKENVVGLVTYVIVDQECEITSLDSLSEGIGVGTLLVNAVKERAVQAGCQRLWLITTNDNLQALRFYQKRGFVLVAIHRNALDVSRKLKPQIPLIGDHGIPLRDEIELEMHLEKISTCKQG